VGDVKPAMTRRDGRRLVSLLLAGAGILLAVGGVVRGVRLWLMPPDDGWVAGSETPPWLWASAGLVLLAGGVLLYLRRMAATRSTPATFLTPEEEQAVVAAIAAAERRTSGEIRVHLAAGAGEEIMKAAAETFERLGMTATRERNGVLFFVDVAARRIAILGDAGIDRRVPDGFWDGVLDRVRKRFAEGRFGEGLAEGIALAGEALAEHFPYRSDDVNELPDQISRDS